MSDVVVYDPATLTVVDTAAVIHDFILIDTSVSTISGEAGGDVIVVDGGRGPQGEDGTPGEPGPTGGYTHTQTTPSASWIVEHNLNDYVCVAVYVDGEIGLADVEFIDLNTLSIPFPEATSGVAAIR